MRVGVLLTPCWSVYGHRVELSWGFRTRVLVDGVPTGLVLRQEAVVNIPLEVGGKAFELRVHPLPDSGRPFIDLYRGEALVPAAEEPMQMSAAPAGARCAVHRELPATVICLRCGGFACAECGYANGLYCAACLALAQENAPLVADRSVPQPAFIATTVLGFAVGVTGATMTGLWAPGWLLAGLVGGFLAGWPFRDWADARGPLRRRGAVTAALAAAVGLLVFAAFRSG